MKNKQEVVWKSLRYNPTAEWYIYLKSCACPEHKHNVNIKSSHIKPLIYI